MYIKSNKKVATRGRRVVAEEEILDTETDAGEVEVAAEATDLLFEAEDVAELVAEVTGEDVEVTADEDAVTFAVGDTEYTVEAEGDEEILEASRKVLKGKSSVAASKRVARRVRRVSK